MDSAVVEYDHFEHLIRQAEEAKGIKPKEERKQPVNFKKAQRRSKRRQLRRERAKEEELNPSMTKKIMEAAQRFGSSFRPNFVSSAACGR